MARSSNTSDKPEPEPWAADRRELEARGLRLVEAGPQLLVNFNALKTD